MNQDVQIITLAKSYLAEAAKFDPTKSGRIEYMCPALRRAKYAYNDSTNGAFKASMSEQEFEVYEQTILTNCSLVPLTSGNIWEGVYIGDDYVQLTSFRDGKAVVDENHLRSRINILDEILKEVIENDTNTFFKEVDSLQEEIMESGNFVEVTEEMFLEGGSLAEEPENINEDSLQEETEMEIVAGGGDPEAAEQAVQVMEGVIESESGELEKAPIIKE